MSDYNKTLVKIGKLLQESEKLKIESAKKNEEAQKLLKKEFGIREGEVLSAFSLVNAMIKILNK